MKDMFDYILESEQTVHQVIEERKETMKEAVDYFVSKPVERMIILGSGTSYHSVLSAKKLMEKLLGIPVSASYPLTFKDECAIVEKNTLVLGISQAGKSTSTIMALDKARLNQLATIACTSDLDAPIKESADVLLPLNIGEEDCGPKTKGFQGSIATLVMFACEVALRQGRISEEKSEEVIERLYKLAHSINDLAEKSKLWVLNNLEELKTCKRLVLVGYEPCLGAVYEGSLKILEGVRCSVTGYQMEEFMHGIYHSIYEDDTMIYLGYPGQYFNRMKNMMRYFTEERSKHMFMITSDESYANDPRCFVYPFINDEDLSTMEYIVPLQVLTKMISEELGINCNVPSDPEFHQKMGSYRY